MQKKGAENIINAVAKAVGRRLDLKKSEDRLLVQKGCFILNEMGVVPIYDFPEYVRGPYSRDLSDDCMAIRYAKPDGRIDVDEDKITFLSEIMKKGTPFIVAYTTLDIAEKVNYRLSKKEVADFIAETMPHLKESIEEAFTFRESAIWIHAT